MSRETGSGVHGLADLTIKLLNTYLLSTDYLYVWYHEQHTQRDEVYLSMTESL